MDLGLATMVIFLFLALVAFVLGVTAYFYYFRLWFRAQLSSASVPLRALVGMTLRKANPRVIVDSYIAAVEAGLDLTLNDIEEYFRGGEDVQEAVQTRIAAKEADGKRASQNAGDAETAGNGAFNDAPRSPSRSMPANTVNTN